MFRSIVGMSFFVCLLSVANAAPNRYSVRVNTQTLRQQEQVAASARNFRSIVYTRYRTDRQAFDHYWAVGEQVWQAWGRADYPAAHAAAVKTWFEDATAIAGGSRFAALPSAPQLTKVDTGSTPFRSVATPSGALQAPSQPAGEVVFPTTPVLPRQNSGVLSPTRESNDASIATPQFLTNPTLVTPDDDDNTNPFETSPANAKPEGASWLRHWKQTFFSPHKKESPKPASTP